MKKGEYSKGNMNQSKISCPKPGHVNTVESRLNAGGDTKFRGKRGHKGGTNHGKGMNKGAY